MRLSLVMELGARAEELLARAATFHDEEARRMMPQNRKAYKELAQKHARDADKK